MCHLLFGWGLYLTCWSQRHTPVTAQSTEMKQLFQCKRDLKTWCLEETYTTEILLFYSLFQKKKKKGGEKKGKKKVR